MVTTEKLKHRRMWVLAVLMVYCVQLFSISAHAASMAPGNMTQVKIESLDSHSETTEPCHGAQKATNSTVAPIQSSAPSCCDDSCSMMLCQPITAVLVGPQFLSVTSATDRVVSSLISFVSAPITSLYRPPILA